MQINIRKVHSYFDVGIVIQNAHHELGLFSRHELLSLRDELREVVSEIEHMVDYEEG